MVLFKVTSYHQFISALIVKLQLLPDEQADIFLSNIVDFTYIAEILKGLSIFRRVEIMDDMGANARYLEMSKEERYKFTKNVPNMWGITLDTQYSAYYFGHSQLACKLLYYYLVKNQPAPEAYSVQEGTASYSVDMIRFGERDGIAHSHYRKRSLLRSLKGQYLFWPDAIKGNWQTPLFQIPMPDEKTSDIIRMLCKDITLPKQKYIFFAICSEMMGVHTNELEILEMLADEVGKENIAVKIHPKTTCDKFTYRGYECMPRDCAAWEFYSFLPELKEKVMVSTISTSLLLPKMLFSQDVYVVMLHNMMRGKMDRLLNYNEFKRFLASITDIMDEDQKRLFIPKNERELHETLKYIEGRLRSGR